MRVSFCLLASFCIFLVLMMLCSEPVSQEDELELIVTSQAFQQREMIPKQFTCDGSNVSPPLAWNNVPEHTKSFALIVDDPDAPFKTWVHWVMYDIPSDQTELQEGIPPIAILTSGAKQGQNDFGNIGYGGPCPPKGTHHYYFRVYALDIMLELGSGLTKQNLLDAMKDHILAKGELMGIYKR